MKISRIIERLELIKARLGDLELDIRNAAGEWDSAEEVGTTSTGRPTGDKYRAYIDTEQL